MQPVTPSLDAMPSHSQGHAQWAAFRLPAASARPCSTHLHFLELGKITSVILFKLPLEFINCHLIQRRRITQACTPGGARAAARPPEAPAAAPSAPLPLLCASATTTSAGAARWSQQALQEAAMPCAVLGGRGGRSPPSLALAPGLRVAARPPTRLWRALQAGGQRGHRTPARHPQIVPGCGGRCGT